MNTPELDSQIEVAEHTEFVSQASLNRRSFFRKAGYFGLGAAAAGLALGSKPVQAQQNAAQVQDNITEIFTAFLIAEDLASTFYYNGLIGGVIQDPNLSGAGGNALHVTSAGNLGNVAYLRAALSEEVLHANLFRDLLTGNPGAYQADPVQTFYFPAGTFDTLANFLPLLDALENAFIGAYLNVIQEFAYKATLAATGGLKSPDTKYSAKQYGLQAKRMASILGVESEHRVLGRVIGNENPANNLTYEGVDGLTSIYNGSASAVVALTPFLTPSTGPGYDLAPAVQNARTYGLPTSGTLINF